MFKRLPYLSLIISLAAFLAVVVPAMATDEVPAPPAAVPPPAASGPTTCTDSSKPTSRISSSRSGAASRGVVRGTASDPHGCGAAGAGSVAHVAVSVRHQKGKRCQYMSSKGNLGKAKSCSQTKWLSAHGTSRWSFGLPSKLPNRAYLVLVRSVDAAGNVGSLHRLHVNLK